MPKITPIHYQRLICVFQKAGFEYDRARGDHMSFVKKDIARPLVIPKYRQVPVFIIQNLIRTAGMSREEYLKWLKKC